MTRREARGITLIELMLVVTFIALLTAFAIPGFNAYIDRAYTTRAIGDIGGISLQFARWQTSFGVFPDTLAEVGLDGLLDPWDQPYVYLNLTNARPGEFRRDKNLNPVNTDYDLYSIGKDGETVTAFTAMKARDDIVRANNGGFIGRAEDY